MIKDNHQRYIERIELYRSMGYDIPKTRDQLVQRLAYLPPEARILDVGTGKGHLSLALARSGRTCVSIDNSDEELRLAQLNARYYGLDNQIDFQKQDACHLTFESDSFDAVLSADLIHHLNETEPVLSEMLRVCRPGGVVIIADLNEHGQQIVAQVHRNEGREHRLIGWPIEQVQKWFEKQGHSVSRFDEDCQTILVISKKVKSSRLE